MSTDQLLLIDAGNTCVKVNLVSNGMLGVTQYYPREVQHIDQLVNKYVHFQKVMSSVLSEEETNKLAEQLSPCRVITSQSPFPVLLNYLTPETLGVDRICNACAMWHLKKTRVAVSIDIGTCIKFDVLEDCYFIGGSISPGIALRYQSLHKDTGRLPLLNDQSPAELTGNSSYGSIHSGVINGIKMEIEGFMDSYRRRYGSELTFFVTGGDAKHFEFVGKNDIFALENLTLEGLHSIYRFHPK